MKKFSIHLNVILVALVVVFVFIACQKEQTAVTDETAIVTENNHIMGTSGFGSFEGSVSQTFADALAKNYSKEYDDKNQTQYVVFSAKDVDAFIKNHYANPQSTDMLYVNFGVYGKGALATNAKDNGRLTVFFTANKPKTTGNNRRFGLDDPFDEYLNHGGLVP